MNGNRVVNRSFTAVKNLAGSLPVLNGREELVANPLFPYLQTFIKKKLRNNSIVKKLRVIEVWV